MGFLRWVAKPRMNYFDCAVAGVAIGLYTEGHWVAAAVVVFAGTIVSVLLEMKAGFQ